MKEWKKKINRRKEKKIRISKSGKINKERSRKICEPIHSGGLFGHHGYVTNGTQFCVYSFTTLVIYPQFLRSPNVKVYIADANVGLPCVATRLGSDRLQLLPEHGGQTQSIRCKCWR
jgi:hypothetical protein